jgi:tripartite-type tricarboxylate transporter receptor subunit TctC
MLVGLNAPTERPMFPSHRHAAVFAAACALLCAQAPARAASDYPNHVIRIIVPYQAGGSTDIVVRKFAELAAPQLGQPIIIENKGGAGATMGARTLTTSAPDGYTLAILPSPVFRMPHIQNVGYDPTTDFTYVTMLSGYVLGVAVPAEAPYKTWAEFETYARAHPGEVTYGTASVGSASNVMMEDIAAHDGVSWRHIPYKGESEVIQAVMGGLVTAYAGSSTVTPMVQSGKMRMLVTWGEARSPLFAATPTLKEINGMAAANAPFGIAAPKNLPPEILAKLQETFKRVTATQAFKDMLTQYGQEPVEMDSVAYTAYAKQQFIIEKGIVQKLGLGGNP